MEVDDDGGGAAHSFVRSQSQAQQPRSPYARFDAAWKIPVDNIGYGGGMGGSLAKSLTHAPALLNRVFSSPLPRRCSSRSRGSSSTSLGSQKKLHAASSMATRAPRAVVA